MTKPMFRAVTIVVPYNKADELIFNTKLALVALERGADEVRVNPQEGIIHFPDGHIEGVMIMEVGRITQLTTTPAQPKLPGQDFSVYIEKVKDMKALLIEWYKFTVRSIGEYKGVSVPYDYTRERTHELCQNTKALLLASGVKESELEVEKG